MVEARGVVIDVSHGHRHSGRAGKALWLPTICGHNQQLVIGPVLPVQQRAGDDLSRRRVDGELAVSTAQAVAVWSGAQRGESVESLRLILHFLCLDAHLDVMRNILGYNEILNLHGILIKPKLGK